MKIFGYEIIEYANGESESEANEKVSLLTENELEAFKGQVAMR